MNVRDGGVCHALLGIETMEELLGHHVIGDSWEGYVIENIISALPRRVPYGYYRTSGGAEIELVIDIGAGGIWAVEVGRSSAPRQSPEESIAPAKTCGQLAPLGAPPRAICQDREPCRTIHHLF